MIATQAAQLVAERNAHRKKKTALQRAMSRMPGFHKRERTYWGSCTDDVMLGYSLDAPPTCIFVCRVLLPTYDEIPFVHLSLGGRMYDATDDLGIECALAAIDADWTEFSQIKNRSDLIADVERRKMRGLYPSWVRYISYIRDRKYADAERMETADGGRPPFAGLPAIAGSYRALTKAKEERGWEGCHELLSAWAARNKLRYGDAGHGAGS